MFRCNFISFQKESPYLEDANALILMASQMGFIDKGLEMYTANATQCLTRSAAAATNRRINQKRVLEIKDLHGMLFILSLGLGGALLVFISEIIFHKVTNKKPIAIGRHGRKGYGAEE